MQAKKLKFRLQEKSMYIYKTQLNVFRDTHTVKSSTYKSEQSRIASTNSKSDVFQSGSQLA